MEICHALYVNFHSFMHTVYNAATGPLCRPKGVQCNISPLYPAGVGAKHTGV